MQTTRSLTQSQLIKIPDQYDLHRMSLEQLAVNALAGAVRDSPDDAQAYGKAMRTAIDALLGIKRETTQEAA